MKGNEEKIDLFPSILSHPLMPSLNILVLLEWFGKELECLNL